MFKSKLATLTAGGILLLGGCAGNGSVSGPSELGGLPLSEFTAVLPDGSPMEIEILANDNLAWEGEFAVAAETGPYVHQVGTFEGSVTGGKVTATCTTIDGDTFQMTGSATSKGLQLTRSDIPGTVLDFKPVHQMASDATRADANFTMTFNATTSAAGSTGLATISTAPYSVQGVLTEYRGSWLGLKVTFWAYSSGFASIVTYFNDFAMNSASFTSFKLSEAGTARLTSSGSKTSVYSPVTKSIFSVPCIVGVAP